MSQVPNTEREPEPSMSTLVAQIDRLAPAPTAAQREAIRSLPGDIRAFLGDAAVLHLPLQGTLEGGNAIIRYCLHSYNEQGLMITCESRLESAVHHGADGRKRLGHFSNILALRLSPDGQWTVTASDSGRSQFVRDIAQD